MPDDPRLSPLWEQAAELAVPVAIHTADPVAFFEPADERNERLEELLDHPEWSFADPAYPRFGQLMRSLEALVAGHPRTRFIGLHAGCNAEDIAWITRMLDTYPNLTIDIAARIAELGRQPRRTRALILRHPGRVLFATDLIPPERESYEIYFRFLETEDEYFDYSPCDPPPTGRWCISGLNLPVDVLRLVYSGNARALIPGLRHQAA
jgi:predicted TIM-barrel fold metal-dependent hydrolase